MKDKEEFRKFIKNVVDQEKLRIELEKAALNEDVARVREIIAQGAKEDEDTSGRKSLLEMVFNAYTNRGELTSPRSEIIKLLVLEFGSDINEIYVDHNLESSTHLSTLVLEDEYESYVRLVLDLGADPNKPANTCLPIVSATSWRNVKNLRILLESGADPLLEYCGKSALNEFAKVFEKRITDTKEAFNLCLVYNILNEHVKSLKDSDPRKQTSVGVLSKVREKALAQGLMELY